MIKLGLIGCGYWGKNYVNSIQNIPHLSLKYVYDKALPSIPIPQNIIFTQNLDDILNDKEIKGVIIAIPTQYIFEVTKKCLEAIIYDGVLEFFFLFKNSVDINCYQRFK